MRSMKFSMIMVHISALILDIFVSLLGIPVIFLPFFAGYGLGLLTYINVPSSVLLYFGISLMCASIVSCVIFLENRYQRVVRVMENGPKWRLIARVVYFGLQFLWAFGFMIPLYMLSPEQEATRQYLMKNDLSCISEKLQNPKFYCLSLKPDWILILLGVTFLINHPQMFFYVHATRTALNRRRTLVSSTTFAMQKKLGNILTFQAFIPLAYFGMPLFYYVFSMVTGYFNQAFNDISFLIVASHGGFSAFVTIAIHKPYRVAVLKVLHISNNQVQENVIVAKPSTQSRLTAIN